MTTIENCADDLTITGSVTGLGFTLTPRAWQRWEDPKVYTYSMTSTLHTVTVNGFGSQTFTSAQWTTIPEDIVGSTFYDNIGLTTYPYKSQLPTPDIRVGLRDIGRAAKAFGSYPSDSRWDPFADIYGDYKIDMRDIGGVARMFGWTG